MRNDVGNATGPRLDTGDPVAGPGAMTGELEPVRAAVLVPPEHTEFAREALRFADQVTFVDDLDGLTKVRADVVLVEHALIADLSPEEWDAALGHGGTWFEPVRVVINAPDAARISLQTAFCVDAATAPGVGSLELLARIWALLRRARLERDRNPLTGLPGNRWLRRRLAEVLRRGDAIGVLLLDIDDFKRYNDTRGHLRGDAAIELVARVAAGCAEVHNGSVATHIGGDDFCILCPPAVLDSIAQECLADFTVAAEALDREAPLTLTAAGTVAVADEADALEEVFARLARLKAQGKDRPGNSYRRVE